MSTRAKGYIYFARFAPDYVKIGFSRDPYARLRTCHHTSGPSDLIVPVASVIGVALGDFRSEAEIHFHFQRFRVGGLREWFHADPSLIEEALSMSIPIGHSNPYPAPPPRSRGRVTSQPISASLRAVRRI